MSIEILPTEILIQVLDDPSLEIGDLAIISKVSHRWHSAVVPVLYRRFTFRYYPSLKPEDHKRLESFSKYGHHVKYLSLHIKDWSYGYDLEVDSESEPVPDIATYLGILGPFSEVTHIEHYDIDIRGISWPIFWAILNYLVSDKRQLISLTVRRNLHWGVDPPSDQDIDPETLLPTPRLSNLTSFNLQVNSKRSGSDSIKSFPYFVNNLVLALGDSCRNVSKLQLYLKMVEDTNTEELAALWKSDFPPLPVEHIKDLRYVVSPGLIPPSRLLDTEFEDTKVLTAPSWVCGRWLNSAWEQVPPGESLNYFKNLEILRITDVLQTDEGNGLEQNLNFVTKHLPKLESLILDDDERQFSISRKPDGSPIWEEVPFVV
ncbi:uncharacterized protein DFL_008104 [Arthrobotrys flagrans]|uniref:F-box domain-containing protein n=1 Tax=Arthrobotrys flagrans TaxID=97331 RepID=A0A436ZMS6_ARTFL|nr:hypothetical protein DFL_008104 [Arthrobotrys flagrans]